MSAPELNRNCQCHGCCIPCGFEMTQEDFLCDACRERKGRCGGLHPRGRSVLIDGTPSVKETIRDADRLTMEEAERRWRASMKDLSLYREYIRKLFK